MILPEPRGDTLHQKGKAFLTTLLLAAVCYGVMVAGSFTLEKPSRRVYREIDLASFAPPEPPPAEPAERADEPAAPNETPAESPEPNPATAQTLAQLDLSRLFPQDADLDVDAMDMEGRRAAERAGQQGESEIAVRSGGLQGLGDLDALNDLGGAPAPASRGRSGRSAGASNAGGIALLGGSASSAPQPGAGPVGDVAVVGENTRRAGNAAATEFTVERLSLDAFGDDYDRLEIQALIDWMKKHPGDLPIGVRQLVRHRPKFLSSVTSFTIDGKPYELYLMCKEELYEVHIVLVDGERSTYLVDRSFQKLSTYLSEGQVRRARGDEITAISSKRSAASGDTSREFYALFLSWWEQAKADR